MIIPVKTQGGSYNITLERGALKKAADYIKIKQGTKVLVITDSGVPEDYAKTVAACFECAYIHTFLMGELSKNFDTYKAICKKLTELSFTRHDSVIAVGGGVVGDISGFAAATYMRGIAFYNIPTTVLSQVDSSIGGKTAIDLDGIKNIIGAFCQPRAVIIDPDVLVTLPERQIRNGLAESIKMGLNFNEELFNLFLKADYMDSIEKIIELSLLCKKYVVEEDEKETGLRKVLNFGHTLGHGIECATMGELYHGECVALGMIPMCGGEVREKLIAALKNVGLPTSAEYDREKAFEALCHDKKSVGGSVTLIKCDRAGSFFMEDTPFDEIRKML